jgi:hypothetical protein
MKSKSNFGISEATYFLNLCAELTPSVGRCHMPPLEVLFIVGKAAFSTSYLSIFFCSVVKPARYVKF